MVEQPASTVDTNHISNDRTQHPGSHSRDEHDPYIELALSSQRARRDQGRITRARQAGSHDRDEREHDDVLGHAHGSAIWGTARLWIEHRRTAAANLNGPAAISWMPRRAVPTGSVSPGQVSTAIAARSAMVS